MSRPPPSPPPITARKQINWLNEIGEAIYGIRWGLVPMYLGLWVAMIAYNLWFFYDIAKFLIDFKEATAETFVMWILGLVDITMIGNLMVMTTVGGYSTFVREFDLAKLEGKPRWMNGLDSSTLKIKTSMSLVMVSGIYLLKTMMQEPAPGWDTVLKLVLMHLVFTVTTLAFTFNARLMPHKAPEHDHH